MLRTANAPPGRVKLDEDVLARLHDDVVKVLADDGRDTAVVVLGDGLGLHVRLQLAGLKVLDKGLTRGATGGRKRCISVGQNSCGRGAR